MQSLSITTRSLKNILDLFDDDAVLERLQLGDTWHPLSGFVDESIFSKNPTVKELKQTAYDFKGLVQFAATIGKVNIKLLAHNNAAFRFEMLSDEKTIAKLERTMAEKNAWSPGKYK